MKKILLIIFLAGTVLLGGCIFAPVKKPTNPNTITVTPTTIDITATQLIKEYLKDVAAANKKYLGRELAVEGVAKEYGADAATKYPYLLLAASDASYTTIIYCTFPDGYDIDVLPKLRIGQTTTITGICRGMENGKIILDSRY